MACFVVPGGWELPPLTGMVVVEGEAFEGELDEQLAVQIVVRSTPMTQAPRRARIRRKYGVAGGRSRVRRGLERDDLAERNASSKGATTVVAENYADLLARQRAEVADGLFSAVRRLRWSTEKLAAERERRLRELLSWSIERCPF